VLTHDYTYAQLLDTSVHRSWTVEDVYQGRDFDFSKSFLPERIAGVRGISCLEPGEKRMLNQIRANAYCHLFAFVEEYIVPMVMQHASRDVYGDETRLWSLLRFAEEEVKHQEMMRRACKQFESGFGVSCGLVEGREAVAQAVLGTSPLSALLLTSLIEWFVQLHYVEHVRDNEALDPLFRDILRFHWIDESRHAKLDTLLIDEIASSVSPEAREQAIDELLALGGAVDDLLRRQVELDVETLERATGRTYTAGDRSEIVEAQQRAYRWTFLVSGLEHPKFTEIVDALTSDGRRKVDAAAEALAA
jgi:para-aminobenzoate N-oxygenase AurF